MKIFNNYKKSKINSDYSKEIENIFPREEELKNSWSFNVLPHLKDKTKEEICDYLDSNQKPFSVLFEHVLHDFNMASGIRNANAFGCRKVYYIGYKRFDKRGTCGVYHYTPVNYIQDLEDFQEMISSHDHIVGLDYIEGKSVSMNKFEWKPNTLLIFGSEGLGLSKFMQSICHDIVHINQYGSVPSLNVATASGIIMNDFVMKIEGDN